jgi:hypothetical protein
MGPYLEMPSAHVLVFPPSPQTQEHPLSREKSGGGTIDEVAHIPEILWVQGTASSAVYRSPQ